MCPGLRSHLLEPPKQPLLNGEAAGTLAGMETPKTKQTKTKTRRQRKGKATSFWPTQSPELGGQRGTDKQKEEDVPSERQKKTNQNLTHLFLTKKQPPTPQQLQIITQGRLLEGQNLRIQGYVLGKT